MFLILRVLISILPAAWLGWALKGLGEWFYPSRLSYSSASGSFATLLLWSGIAAGIVAIIKAVYPEKSILAAVFQAFRDFWGWVVAQWNATTPPA